MFLLQCLQERARRMFCVYEGDHLTLLNVYNAFIRVSKSLYCFCFKAVVQLFTACKWCMLRRQPENEVTFVDGSYMLASNCTNNQQSTPRNKAHLGCNPLCRMCFGQSQT